MATEKDVVHLQELLREGDEVYKLLHLSSIERRKPDSPMSYRIVQADPGTGSSGGTEQWTEEECDEALVAWQEERDGYCAELLDIKGWIEKLLVGSLARWVAVLPEAARQAVFDIDRMILAVSGLEHRWKLEIEMWEEGSWDGLFREGFISACEHTKLLRYYPNGNPKFPEKRTERRPLDWVTT